VPGGDEFFFVDKPDVTPPVASDPSASDRTSLLGRVVFVGDCGMVTRYNLDDLRHNGHGYIIGRNRCGEVRPGRGSSVPPASPPARMHQRPRRWFKK
jgi:hypothetical protein